MDKKNIKFNMALSYVDMSVTILISFLYIPVLVQFIGKTDYGLFNLITAITAYTSLAQLGLSSAITRYTSKFIAENRREKISELISLSLFIYSITSFLAFSAGLIVYFNFGVFFNLSVIEISKGQAAFLIAMIAAVVSIPGNLVQSLVQGHNSYPVIYYCNIAKYILRVFVITALLYIGYGFIVIFVVDFIIDVSIRLIFIIYLIVKHKVDFRLKKFDRSFFKEISNFSVYIFIGYIADLVFWRTDTLLLGIFKSTSEVAVYAVTENILAYFMKFAVTFSSVFLPVVTAMIVRKEEMSAINRFFTKASRFQFILIYGIMLNFIFLGKDFIILWMGKEFADAYIYALIIMIPLTIAMFQTTGVSILFSMNKHRVRAVALSATAIFNIVSGIFLIQKFGTVGAAIATGLTTLIGNVIFVNIYYKYALKLKLMRFFSEVCFSSLLGSTPAIFVFIALNWAVPETTLPAFCLKACAANLVYFTSIYLISLKSHEQKEISGIIINKLKTKSL